MYRIGDKVKIKSLDWYNENKDEGGSIECGDYYFIDDMAKYCGKTLTITNVFDDLLFHIGTIYYLDAEDGSDDDCHNYNWTEEMFECLVNMEPVERYFHICYQDAVGNICYTEVKLKPDEKANQETFSKKIFGDDKYVLIAWSLVEE